MDVRIIITICALTTAHSLSHDGRQTTPALSNSSNTILPNNTAPSPPEFEGTPSLTECYIKTERLYSCRNQSANIEGNATEDYNCTYCRNEFEDYARACLNRSSADAEISALNESCSSEDAGSLPPLSVECIEAREELVKCQPSTRERLCITCYSQWVITNFKCSINPLGAHIIVSNFCHSPLPGSSPITPVTPSQPTDQVTDKCRRIMDEASLCLDESYIKEQEVRCENCQSSVSKYINQCIDMSDIQQIYINLVENQLKRLCHDQLETSEETSSISTVEHSILLTTLLLFLSLLS